MQFLCLLLVWGLTAKILTLNATAAAHFIKTEADFRRWHWCGAWDAFFANLSELSGRSISAANSDCGDVPVFLLRSSSRVGNWIYRFSR
jgi:hypothetical protein